MTTIVNLFACTVLATCPGLVDASGGSGVPLAGIRNARFLVQARAQPSVASSSGGQPTQGSGGPPATTQPAQPSRTGAATNPRTPPAATQPRNKSTDKLEYDAHMSTARAFAEADEDAKAIEAYEKAILAAPNEKARKEAESELNSIDDWGDGDWFAPSVGVIQSMWIWIGVVILVYALIALGLLLRRLVRWCWVRLGGNRRYRVIVGPRSENELTPYFLGLIQRAHDLFEEQMVLARKIGAYNSTTIASSFKSTSLLIDLPFRLPQSATGKWWWVPFIEVIVRRLDGADYTVNLAVLRTENDYGLSVRLCNRGRLMQHWHESCPGTSLADTMARLAQQVVCDITEQHRKGNHVP